MSIGVGKNPIRGSLRGVEPTVEVIYVGSPSGIVVVFDVPKIKKKKRAKKNAKNSIVLPQIVQHWMNDPSIIKLGYNIQRTLGADLGGIQPRGMIDIEEICAEWR